MTLTVSTAIYSISIWHFEECNERNTCNLSEKSIENVCTVEAKTLTLTRCLGDSLVKCAAVKFKIAHIQYIELPVGGESSSLMHSQIPHCWWNDTGANVTLSPPASLICLASGRWGYSTLSIESSLNGGLNGHAIRRNCQEMVAVFLASLNFDRNVIPMW